MSIKAVRLAGTRAVLVDLTDLPSVLALHAQLEANPLPGQQDVLAAAQTVLVKTDSLAAAQHALRTIPTLTVDQSTTVNGKLVTVEVTYNGEDLQEVSRLTGLSIEAVVNAHTSQTWTAAFGGFAPGFAYLLGEHRALNVPRRDSPRTVVPSGSVALAGDYSAVYPRQSPGGWQLIGYTNTAMWDLSRDYPALIRPQDQVQFKAVTEQALLTASTEPKSTATIQSESEQSTPGLKIVNPGLQSLLQDLGRVGQGNLGVTVSGAADTRSSRQANRLVGNRFDAAVIENLTGSFSATAITDVVMAVTGAQTHVSITPAPEDELRTERTAQMNTAFALLPGETLTLTPAGNGLRTYLGIRGGFLAPQVLGSRARDTLSGLGPAALTAGQNLDIGSSKFLPAVGNPETSTLPAADEHGDYLLRIVPGPRQDWFLPETLTQLTAQRWCVSSDSNRVGIRLTTVEDGTPLVRLREGELASEGVSPGSLQIPPSGLPVLFLADHPVTGGYPVIATVVAEDLSAAAQLPPGATLRFCLTSLPATDS